MVCYRLQSGWLRHQESLPELQAHLGITDAGPKVYNNLFILYNNIYTNPITHKDNQLSTGAIDIDNWNNRCGS